MGDATLDLAPEAGRVLPAGRVVGRPCRGRDREAGRHGYAEIRHLRQFASLSAKEGTHGAAALRSPVGEGVNVLGAAPGRTERLSLRSLPRPDNGHVATTPWARSVVSRGYA